MANKTLFASRDSRHAAVTRNHAGGAAYELSARQALAQLAITGCLNQTHYMSAELQLDELIAAAHQVEPEFLARTAIYCRKRGYMKDTPALLTALLASISPDHLGRAFAGAIDNGRMLRNFVQIMRSGVTGRRSLGTRPKRLVQDWLNGASDMSLLRASIGQDPSLADIIKMVHPRPATKQREAFYAWLIGKPCDVELLPEMVRAFIAFKQESKGRPIPDVPFQMLTSAELTRKHWAKIAENGGWQMLRMNLNTFHRHGVFEISACTRRLAKRLADRGEIARARVFPYQLMAAWMHADPKLPMVIREALQDAMELAIENVPVVRGRVVVCPDVSGSMSSPVTGHRYGSSSAIRCVDVAALFAAAILRRNPEARIMPFDFVVQDIQPNPRDTVMTNARLLASIGGGGTACSAPIARLNAEQAAADLVILVSDNESWADRRHGRGTPFMAEWQDLKRRCPDARLVCLDITPNATTPAYERNDVLNIGGFSDQVFELISAFADDRLGPDHWVGEIERIEL